MTINLKVNGQNHAGWQSIKVNLSMEALSGGFELKVTERWPDGQRTLVPGDACELLADNDVLITGYLDQVNPSIDKEAHSLVVSGRDKSGDLVDCSAMNTPGQWAGKKLDAIAKDLCSPFGIPIKVETNVGEAFSKFNIEQGETVYETLKRLAELRAVLILSDGKGGLIITNRSTQRSADALVCKSDNPSNNVLRANLVDDHRERFSQITIKGQTQGSQRKKAATVSHGKGISKDATITRHRPLLVMAEGQANTSQCQIRSDWEKTRRAAQSTRLTADVQGWRQSNGQLWAINRIIPVDIPTLNIKQDMLIIAVNFTLDSNNGTITTLTLLKPESYDLVRKIAS